MNLYHFPNPNSSDFASKINFQKYCICKISLVLFQTRKCLHANCAFIYYKCLFIRTNLFFCYPTLLFGSFEKASLKFCLIEYLAFRDDNYFNFLLILSLFWGRLKAEDGRYHYGLFHITILYKLTLITASIIIHWLNFLSESDSMCECTATWTTIQSGPNWWSLMNWTSCL